jgi:GNAT superfamily N-acetyltransferase
MSKENCRLRPLLDDDVLPALEIIKDFDEDDYECAQESFQNKGLDDLYVLVNEQEVIGVTGFTLAGETRHSYWLDWTYLAEEYKKQGLGKQMLEELFEILRQKDCRKLFVQVSTYNDPEDGAIYADALNFYKAMGFTEELVHHDYYESDESQLIYSYVFKSPVPSSSTPIIDKRSVVLNGVFEIDETEGMYAIDWDFSKKNKASTVEMPDLIEEAKKRRARSLLISFPSNVPNTASHLKDLGFSQSGILSDYFDEGVHEIHFRYDF